MPDTYPRRRVLQLTGTALAASFGGCATLLGDVQGLNNSSNPEFRTPISTTGTDLETIEEPISTDSEAEASVETTAEPFSTDSVEITRPTVSFANEAPIPDAPDQYRYATMGPSDAPLTATVYGNWKCPYTRTFILEQVDDIVADFVEPGELALEFRSVGYRSDEPFLGPDAPRAARAGLSVWHTDPAAYWTYLAYVFENQPQERHEWAQPELLLRFATEASVRNRTQVGRDIADNAYARAVEENTIAASVRDIHTVPRVAVDGVVTAPTVAPDVTRAQLERATDS